MRERVHRAFGDVDALQQRLKREAKGERLRLAMRAAAAALDALEGAQAALERGGCAEAECLAEEAGHALKRANETEAGATDASAAPGGPCEVTRQALAWALESGRAYAARVARETPPERRREALRCFEPLRELLDAARLAIETNDCALGRQTNAQLRDVFERAHDASGIPLPGLEPLPAVNP